MIKTEDTIDKNLVRQRFTQALYHYDEHACVQQRINRLLISLLQQYSDGSFQQAFELGCGTGDLTQLLQENFHIKDWFLNDLCALEKHIQHKLPSLNFTFIEGDMETIDFPQGNDLIASASAVQWLSQPYHFVQKCAQALKPDAWLLLSTFTESNLKEIKALTHIGLDYPSITDWQAWLATDFELIVCQQENWILPFTSPIEVLQHLKLTGVTGIQRQGWSPSQYRTFIRDYQQHFSLSSGEVSLSYSPLFLLARKK